MENKSFCPAEVEVQLKSVLTSLLISLICCMPAYAYDPIATDALRNPDNVLHLITGASTILAFVLGLFVPYRKRASNLRQQAAMEWLTLLMVPVLTYTVGAWIVESLSCCNGGFS